MYHCLILSKIKEVFTYLWKFAAFYLVILMMRHLGSYSGYEGPGYGPYDLIVWFWKVTQSVTVYKFSSVHLQQFKCKKAEKVLYMWFRFYKKFGMLYYQKGSNILSTASESGAA
jgi:hypothetical protein